MLFIIKKFPAPIEQPTCHSTIGSCYEKLEEAEKAIDHYWEALKLREIYLGADDEDAQHVRKKLSKFAEKMKLH